MQCLPVRIKEMLVDFFTDQYDCNEGTFTLFKEERGGKARTHQKNLKSHTFQNN